MKLDPSAFVADPQLIQALEKRSTTISCGEDRVLFRQGDFPAGLYLLHKGEVTLIMDSRLGDAVLSIQAAVGLLLGLPGLIGNEPYTLTATARSGAQLSFVTRDVFIALMQSDPLLSLKVLQVLAAEVRYARSAILQR
ncbi:MAG: cyclic nucleotide-binding domain-containing protein [Terracidiphilus sp.]